MRQCGELETHSRCESLTAADPSVFMGRRFSKGTQNSFRPHRIDFVGHKATITFVLFCEFQHKSVLFCHVVFVIKPLKKVLLTWCHWFTDARQFKEVVSFIFPEIDHALRQLCKDVIEIGCGYY